MKCPVCVKEGRTSEVYPKGGFTTAMYCQPFYDEEGKYHNHDANITTHGLSCSNNHSWTERTSGSCWCGWRGIEEA